MEHCEGMRERFYTHANTHANTHMYVCTRTHTGLLWLLRPVHRKATMGPPHPRSGHIGLRAIVCVLSTSKIRRKVGPNVWLWGLCAEWARSTGDSIMALAWENSTIVLETLMALVGSVWAGLSSSLLLPQNMTLTTHCLWVSGSLTRCPGCWPTPTGSPCLDPHKQETPWHPLIVSRLERGAIWRDSNSG